MSRLVLSSLFVLTLAACSAPEAPVSRVVASPRPRSAPGVFTTPRTNEIVESDERAAISGADNASPLDNKSAQAAKVGPPCSLWLKEVPDGIAVVFTPRGESLASLRQRVRRVAAEQNAARGQRDELAEIPIRPKFVIPIQASERDTQGGAELLLTTPKASDVTTLRALVRWHEADMLPDMAKPDRRPQLCPTTSWVGRPA